MLDYVCVINFCIIIIIITVTVTETTTDIMSFVTYATRHSSQEQWNVTSVDNHHLLYASLDSRSRLPLWAQATEGVAMTYHCLGNNKPTSSCTDAQSSSPKPTLRQVQQQQQPPNLTPTNAHVRVW